VSSVKFRPQPHLQVVSSVEKKVGLYMLQFLLSEIAKPLGRRISGYVGVSLSSLGVAASDISTIQVAIPVIVGVGLDLILSNFNRKKA
jgi:hypothetical protein